MLALLLKIASVLFILWVGLRWFEWQHLYFPDKHVEPTPTAVGLDFEEIWFVSDDDNNLHGWWIPHSEARGAVIMCHGNGGDIADRLYVAEDLHALKLNVFLFDYRGFGNSKGLSTEKGLYTDARAAYEWVRTRYNDEDDPPVILYGRSLGGAVATRVALEKSIRGLILESTFTSIPAMAAKKFQIPLLPHLVTQRYNTLAIIEQIQVPVLLSHGPDDTLIPFKMSQQLYNQITAPKTFVELNGNHNDSGWRTTPAYQDALELFVRSIFPTD